MNILIIGSSWGVFAPWKNYNNESQTVINIASLGQSNIKSLISAKSFLLANDIKFDLIVWYYIGLMRDHSPMNTSLTFNDYLSSVNDKVIEHVESIRNDYPNIKWAVIGASPMYDSQRYAWADFIVENWIGDMFQEVGETIPSCQCLGARYFNGQLNNFKEKYPHCTDDINKEIEADNIIHALRKKYTPDIFADEIHPNLDKATSMCDQILNHFRQ
jgi:hypothetical protein